jgi:hypothetical protein
MPSVSSRLKTTDTAFTTLPARDAKPPAKAEARRAAPDVLPAGRKGIR